MQISQKDNFGGRSQKGLQKTGGDLRVGGLGSRSRGLRELKSAPGTVVGWQWQVGSVFGF